MQLRLFMAGNFARVFVLEQKWRPHFRSSDDIIRIAYVFSRRRNSVGLSHLATKNDVLVSVIVPAYNAAETIEGTLNSVRHQTYSDFEVIVVDDGSTDDTRRIVESIAMRDSRISVLGIPNSGVAAARNMAITAARGNLIAPIDADDIWHPEKLALQIDALRLGGPHMGYVYCGYRRIDMKDRVLDAGFVGRLQGKVFARSILSNFVGNGSTPLIRREALAQVGGYSTMLHKHGVQGAEDWLLQILLARHWSVGVVPVCLTGYRMRPDSMSMDKCRMSRSVLLMLDIVEAHYPDAPTEILNSVRAYFSATLVKDLLRRSKGREAAAQFWEALRCSPGLATTTLSNYFLSSARKRIVDICSSGSDIEVAKPHFWELEPEAMISEQWEDRVGGIGPVFRFRQLETTISDSV
jgi:hypothetical protein